MRFKKIQTSTQLTKRIIITILTILLIASCALAFAGLTSIHKIDQAGFESSDVYLQVRKLKIEADTFYDDHIAQSLKACSSQEQADATATAKRLLEESWQDSEALNDYDEVSLWKLLAMTYSASPVKKITPAQRRSIKLVKDKDAMRAALLKALANHTAASDDPILKDIEALKNAPESMMALVFLSSWSSNASILDKTTSINFIRSAGSTEAAVVAYKAAMSGNISALAATIMAHSHTVTLISVLVAIDSLLLFIFMAAGKSWKMDFKWILILLIVDFLLIFQLLPLIYLLFKAFFPNGSFTFNTFTRLYTEKMNFTALSNTVIAATCTMILGTIIAFPLAWLIGRTNMYGKKFFRALFVLTYMVPPYVGAMAWLRLLNKNVGTINLIIRALFHLKITEGPFNIYSLPGMIWVLTTFYFPYAFITISRAMEKMDPSLEEASRASGASPFMTVMKITLPMMTPSLIAGALLVFVSAASCYGIPSIIGSPGNVHTVTTRIIEYYGLGVSGINDATGLAVFLIVIAVIVLYISDVVIAKRQYITVSGKSTSPVIVDLRSWRVPMTLFVSLFAIIAVAIPFSTILITSFKVDVGQTLWTTGNFTTKQWNALLRGETLSTIKNSLIFGTLAATIGIVIAITMSYLLQRTTIRGRKIPDFLITLGSGTPSVVIALGLIMTMRGQFGVNIYNTAYILIVAYLIKYLMMGQRTVVSAMSQIHVSLEECSQISGASWLKTMFKITGPLIFPSIAAGWFLIFIPSFYELSMTTLLYSTNTKTIGFQLYQYWTFTSQPQACAMAFGILMIIVILNVLLNYLTDGKFSI
ncbi:MAG: iron ABC transporter permease [Erysipelotrichaceae bacterium]|nr:iron ABC transporter permease [Erysipelotrichaceae bacterium]